MTLRDQTKKSVLIDSSRDISLFQVIILKNWDSDTIKKKEKISEMNILQEKENNSNDQAKYL